MGRAIQYIAHTFRLIFENLKEALHVSLAWFLVIAIVAAILFWITGLDASLLQGGQTAPASGFFWFVLVLSLLGLFAFGAIAVSWHRFVLLDEKIRGVLPLPPANLIFRYVLRSLGITFLVLLAFVVLMLVVMLILHPLLQTIVSQRFTLGTFLILSLPNLFLMVLLQYVTYRLFISLPPVALGRDDFSIMDGWRAAAQESSTIWWIVTIMALFTWGMGLLFTLPFISFDPPQMYPTPIWVTVLQAVFQWIWVMFSICILTTLYGVLVEGRDI